LKAQPEYSADWLPQRTMSPELLAQLPGAQQLLLVGVRAE
jgi:hypothetical protein